LNRKGAKGAKDLFSREENTFMSDTPQWHDLGEIEALKTTPLQQLVIGRMRIALSYRNGKFGAVSGVCNHVGGPLGDGTLEGEYIVCPWHYYKYHCVTGEGEPGFEADRVPRYELKEADGHLFINLDAVTTRSKLPHKPHPLARPIKREDGKLRILGISTTAMDSKRPRYSTSDALLTIALEHAESLDAETKMIRINELKFRHCEGFYSKGAHACTWPCSITQLDKTDQMEQVYEALVHWCDAVIIASPIRWGSASALYFKMIERMNCIQNQITIANNVLIRNKIASFIITGGQDNIQAVAGHMLLFFSELGFDFPQFPFIAHSRGWSAEDMERNIAYVKRSVELQDGAKALAERTLEKARYLITQPPVLKTERAGRKSHKLDVVELG
jgi:multimeric flavodoxin WrbA/nitrite reductase/ring-hydroxylating ferredoxin subunit